VAPLLVLCVLASAGRPTDGASQQVTPYRPDRVGSDAYARAERFLSDATDPLVFGASVRPNWVDGDRFWYRNDIPEGKEFVRVDPGRRTRERAFDHQALAQALSVAMDTTITAFALPFTSFDYVDGGIRFDVGERSFRCDLPVTRCTAGPLVEEIGRDYVPSPDGTKAAFRRDHNLWVLDVATGRETQLTTDGIESYGYATDNAGWRKSDAPVVDSKKIATFQQDERGVGDMYLVSTAVGHPTLQAWKYPLPEDTVIFRISRVIVDLDGPRVVRLKMPPDQHRSTICDDI